MFGIDYDTLWQLAIAVGTPLVRAAIYLIAGFQLARLARDWVERAMRREAVGWSGTRLISRLVSVAIKITSILFALIALGVSPTGLIAVFGAFTVAIGLSLQDVFKNVFAGIYLLIERPFRAGDRISIRNVTGEVQGIDIRTTLVRNLQSELVLIPNAIVLTEVLHNDTHFGVRRLDFTIKSSEKSATDIDRLIREHFHDVQFVRPPIPAARIVASTPSELTVTSSLMIDDTDEAEIAIAERVLELLPAETIEVTSS